MAQQVIFNIPEDLNATKLLDDFCNSGTMKYERTKLEGETKKQFLMRKTVEFWFQNAAQGKAKAEMATWMAEYSAMNITGS